MITLTVWRKHIYSIFLWLIKTDIILGLRQILARMRDVFAETGFGKRVSSVRVHEIACILYGCLWVL